MHSQPGRFATWRTTHPAAQPSAFCKPSTSPAAFPPDSGDLEETLDLVPATGQYPVEKVQHTHVAVDEIKISATPQARIDIVGSGFTRIDLMALAGAESGFKSVAFGALLTINQGMVLAGACTWTAAPQRCSSTRREHSNCCR
jgi:hypothetical protein